MSTRRTYLIRKAGLASLLLYFLVSSCLEEESFGDITGTLLKADWIADQYKFPAVSDFGTFPLSEVYVFNADGKCLIKRPYTDTTFLGIDTIEKWISWSSDNKRTVILDGKDTTIYSTDTLIMEISDWKILELGPDRLKVEHLDKNGLPLGYILILKAR